MSSLPNNEFWKSNLKFWKGKIFLKAFNSHMVCYIVINSFFVSFEISGGSYNRSWSTFRLINEFEKCILSFMESLIADFVQFSSAIIRFLFLILHRALDCVCTQFRDFTKLFSFSKLFKKFFSTSILLSHGQLWIILEGIASLTRC